MLTVKTANQPMDWLLEDGKERGGVVYTKI